MRVILFGTASAVAAAGLMPGPSAGGGVGVGVRVGALSAEISGRAETMFDATRVASGDRLDASVLSGMLAPCGHIGGLVACGLT